MMKKDASSEWEEVEMVSKQSPNASDVVDHDLSTEKLRNLTENQDKNLLAELGGVEGLAASLHSDLKRGPTDDVVSANREKYGANLLPVKRVKWFFEHLYESFQDLTIMILVVSGILTIIFGAAISQSSADMIQGGAILLAVLVVSGVTSVVNWLQDREFASLSKLKEDRFVTVLRGAEATRVSVFDLVVGDILTLEPGEVLPVDGVLIRGSGVLANQSALTGESMQKSKTPKKDPFLLGGSKIDAGSGCVLVVAVGSEASYGRIVTKLQEASTPQTPLQKKLDVLATRIGYVGFLFGFITFVALTGAWLGAGGHLQPVDEDGHTWYQTLLGFFIVAITIVVVAVPEGLPLAVTLSLAFSMQRMAKDQNLVRNLASCETMGSATTICSDKTGTLTQNRMTVTRALIDGKIIDASEVAKELGEDRVAVLRDSIVGNSTASIRDPSPGQTPPEYIGNVTECAMLLLTKRELGANLAEVRETLGQPFYREPFSSDRKRMTSAYLRGEEEGAGLRVFVKGAAETMIQLCVAERGAEGEEAADMTEERRAELSAAVKDLQAMGLRALAVCEGHVDADAMPCAVDAEDAERDQSFREDLASEEGVVEGSLHLLAVLGIKDPLRDGVAESVRVVQGAGVTVRMVTGDALPTARHIAAECGILPSLEASVEYDPEAAGGSGSASGIDSTMTTSSSVGERTVSPANTKAIPHICMEGRQYRAMEEEDRRQLVPKLAVLARSIPADKLMLVKDLQALGEVVAVTGDGSNDAPALKQANVGLSMGIAGTEVAKEASDIVLLDDSFSSVERAVAWGRNVVLSVQRFLALQLTVNLSSLMITVVVASSSEGSVDALPLTPLLLLFLNLIMDSLAALALSTESPDPRLMQQAPNGFSKPLLSKIILKYIIGEGLWQFGLLAWLTFDTTTSRAIFLLKDGDSHHMLLTAIYNTYVLTLIVWKFHCRKVSDELNISAGLLESHFAHVIIALIIALQIIIVELGGSVFRMIPLSAEQWLVCSALALVNLPIGYLLRMIPIFDEDDHIAKSQPQHHGRNSWL